MKGRQKSLVPRFFSFFLFSGGPMTWMGRPDTSVFLLSPLFRGGPRRHYKSVSIFSGGTISAVLRMPDFLEEEGDTECRTV